MKSAVFILLIVLFETSVAKTVDYFTWNETRFETHTRELGSNPDRFSDSFMIDYNRDQRWFTSQLGQDEFILELNGGKSEGFFVDLASNDYSFLSNTQGLERYRNWKGICIEPNPQYHDDLLAKRRCTLVTNPVYSRNNKEVHFHLDDWASGIVGSDMDNKSEEKIDLKLSTVTLKEILDFLKAPQVMEYLSLDVEGGELHVMQHLLRNSDYTFLTMTVERPTEHLHHLLHEHGYWMATQLPLPHIPRTAKVARFGEIVYIHKTHPDFRKHMEKYRPSAITSWYGEEHNFLLQPAFQP